MSASLPELGLDGINRLELLNIFVKLTDEHHREIFGVMGIDRCRPLGI